MSKDCYSNINNPNGNNYGTVPPRPPKKGEPNTVTTMSQLNNFVNTKVVKPEPASPKQAIEPPGPTRSRLPNSVNFPPRGLNMVRKELQCPSPSETNCNISNNVIEIYKDPYSKCEVNSARYDPVIRSLNNVKGKNIDLCGNITLGQTFPNTYYSTSYKGYLNYKKCKFPLKYNKINNSNCDVSNNKNNPSYCGNLVTYNKDNQYPNRPFLTNGAVSGASRINRLRYKNISCTKNNYPNDATNPFQRCGLYIGGNASYQNIHKKSVICNTISDLARIRGRNIDYGSTCGTIPKTIPTQFKDTNLNIIITLTEDYAYWKNILNQYSEPEISVLGVTVTSSATITSAQLTDLCEPIIIIKKSLTIVFGVNPEGPAGCDKFAVTGPIANLTNITLNNLQQIGENLLISNCENITSIVMKKLLVVRNVILCNNENILNIDLRSLYNIKRFAYIQENVNLTTLTLTNLELIGQRMWVYGNSSLVSLTFDSLVSVGLNNNDNSIEEFTWFYFGENTSLTTCTFPELKQVGSANDKRRGGLTMASFELRDSKITSYSFPKWKFAYCKMYLEFCTELTEILFPELLFMEGFLNMGGFASPMPNLKTISLPKITRIGEGLTLGEFPALEIIEFPSIKKIQPLESFGEPKFPVGFNISNCNNLQTIRFSNLVEIFNGEILIINNNSLTELNFSKLELIQGSITVNDCGAMTSIDFPKLKIQRRRTIFVDPETKFDIASCGSLTTINFPLLEECLEIIIGSNNELTTINLPLLISALERIQIGLCPKVTEFSLPSLETIIADTSGSITEILIDRNVLLEKIDIPFLYLFDGSLTITENPELLDIIVPDIFTGSKLIIQNNAKLPIIASFVFLQTVDVLLIEGNDLLTTITFSFLSNPIKSLQIRNNVSLTSISFPVLSDISGSLLDPGFPDGIYIENNTSLVFNTTAVNSTFPSFTDNAGGKCVTTSNITISGNADDTGHLVTCP